ncbi:MAG: TonB-dependent receptor domain-containing protein [Thermoguttaceae bacterium]
MRYRRKTAAALVVTAFWWLGGGVALSLAAGQSQGTAVIPADLPANDNLPAPTASASPTPSPANTAKVDDLLNLDMDQLSKVRVSTVARATNLNAPSTQVGSDANDLSDATTTGELARQAPSVSIQKTSALNLDPRVRGYRSGELNASANGMNELKTRLDIDSEFSQIDPGIISDLTVIDGPYTSLYGPGFAFLAADLLSPPRYANGPEAHGSTNLVYGTNGSTLYNRDNVLAGGKDWGVICSYGVRTGEDYLTGGSSPYRIPSSYQKWDTLLSVSKDLGQSSRIEFDLLHTEINNTELPGVVYDLDNSTNSQYNVRYIVQEDPKGPRNLVLQSWFSQTSYSANASRPEKQQTLYEQFFTLADYQDFPNNLVNTVGQGHMETMGARALRTFGEANSPQWTIGADFRRVNQSYLEEDFDASGNLAFGGSLYGIPHSYMDDFGVLTDLFLPLSDKLSLTIGGRVDYCKVSLDQDDPIVTQGLSSFPPTPFWPGYEEPAKTLGMAYVTAKYNLTDQYTLKAGTGFSMRMPDLAELYSYDPYVPYTRFGNSYVDGLSTLDPEQDLQFDLGLSYKTKRCSWTARGFFALIHDYIMPVPEDISPSPPNPPIQAPIVLGRNFSDFPAQFRQDLTSGNENADTNQAGYQYVNLNLATLLGGDLSAEATLQDGLTVFGSMSYVRGTDCSPVQFISPADGYAPHGQVASLGGAEGLPGIYPLNGILGVRIFDPTEDRWMLEFNSRLVARQDHLAVSVSEIGTSGFAVFGLRGYYRVRKNVRLSMAVENLFNQPYTEPGSLAIINPQGVPAFVQEPGISVLLGVDARF